MKSRARTDRPTLAAGGFAALVATLVVNIAEATEVTDTISITYTEGNWVSGCPVLSGVFNQATNNFNSEWVSSGVLVEPNTNPKWANFVDVSYSSLGKDSLFYGIDSKDMVFIGTHGLGVWTPSSCYTTENVNCVAQSWTAEINQNYSGCDVNSVGFFLGNNDAEFAAAFACNSLEVTATSHLSSRMPGLHQWHGFYGTTASGTGTSTRTDDYVDDAQDGAAAWAWIENETSWDHWGGSSDACGLAFAKGNSGADATSRRDNENMASTSYTYSDPTTNHWSRVGYCRCDPPHPVPGDFGSVVGC